MDDSEYYSMMRRQYSNIVNLTPKKIGTNKSDSKRASDCEKSSAENSVIKTEGTFSEWNLKYGREDAEMFLERNNDDDDDE